MKLVLVLLASCVPLPVTGTPGADPERLIAHLEPEPEHVVEFYELAPGRIAVLEQGSLDRKPLDLAGTSPAALHARLAPGKLPPDRLRHVDAAPAVLTTPGLHMIREPPSPAAQATGSVESSTATQDANWWHAAFCSDAAVDAVWCPTSVARASSGWRPTMFYEVAGMSESGTAEVWLEDYTTSWRRLLTVRVGPRRWWRWWYDGEATFRAGVTSVTPGARVHFAERYRQAITSFAAQSEYPRGAEWQFNNDIQGVTHDAANWYFTRTVYPVPVLGTRMGIIAKAPIGYDLRREPAIRFDEPRAMLDAGYNHYGDLTRRNSLLYVAIDGSAGAGIAVIQTDISRYVGWTALPGLRSCPWIAYNPRDDLFYVPDGTRTLRRYAITVHGTTVTATEALPRVTLSTEITNQQGGDFSSRGVLYLSRGYKANPMAVYGVDVVNGRVYLRVAYNGSPASDWEAEGVTIWDLSAGQAPGIRGHLHLQLLDNDPDNDDFTFAHLSAVDPSRL